MDGADFHRLPEGCIAHILSLTSPRDVCRSSAVSTIFRSASESDAVWENFLPSDYLDIISRMDSTVEMPSKKQLYFWLCNSNLMDSGKMSFHLEKSSGKKCYMVSARELAITWTCTPRYWRWISHPESRFSDVAELLMVCWLEIQGKFETSKLSAETTYGAFLLVKFTVNAFGLSFAPTELTVRSGSYASTQSGYLVADGTEMWSLSEEGICPKDFQIPQARSDGWMEIEIGEFFVHEQGEGVVEMSLMEIKSGNVKAGLIIEGIEIRPKMGSLKH